MAVSYALRGSTGFGAAAAMPLLALIVPLKVLIPAWTLIGLTAGVTLLGRDRAHVAWGDLARLLPSCLIGIAIGLYAFTALDARTLAQGLGVLIVLYGIYSLLLTGAASVPSESEAAPESSRLTRFLRRTGLHFAGKRYGRPQKSWQASPRKVAPIAGMLGGAVGTTFGTMASVFFAIYFDIIRMTKDNFRATMSAILVALSVVRGLGYWAVGEYSRDVLITVAIALPMMLLGIFIGNRIHTGLSDLAFRRLVAAALIVSGVALLARSG
jgi:uncharacterized membrane protein YfcA